MIRIIWHFNRTVEFGKIIGIDFEKNTDMLMMMNRNNLDSCYQQIDEYINSTKKTYSKKIKEIFEIEKERIELRDSKDLVKEIFKKEKIYNIQRESILSLDFDQLLNTQLVLNPLVNIYESDWKWVEREPLLLLFNLKKIVDNKKDNHYFLFERTGTYDELLDSNIFEFPLSEYQYFLLQLFEEPQKVKSVIKEFVQEFNINKDEERNQLLDLTKHLIQELIFRRLIIIPNKLANDSIP